MERLERIFANCDFDKFDGRNSFTPLQVAIKWGNSFTFDFLLGCKTKGQGRRIKDPVNSKGRTSLHIAAIYNRDHMLRQLIARGCDPARQDDHGDHVLHHACKSNANDVFEVVLKDGEDKYGRSFIRDRMLTVKNRNGETPLSLALKNTNDKISTMILDKYGTAGVKDINRGFPVHSAAAVGSEEMLELLIQVRKSNLNFTLKRITMNRIFF